MSALTSPAQLAESHTMKPIHFMHVLGVHRRNDEFLILIPVLTGFLPDLLKRQIPALGLAFGVFDKAGIGCRFDDPRFDIVRSRLHTGAAGNRQGQRYKKAPWMVLFIGMSSLSGSRI